MTVVYDAAVLIAADRNDRDTWADHRARLEIGHTPITTAPVVAQVSRSPRQVPLRLFLRGCRIEPFTDEDGHRVGAVLAKTRTSDVVDGHVAVTASRNKATILTGDPADLEALAEHLRPRPPVRSV